MHKMYITVSTLSAPYTYLHHFVSFFQGKLKKWDTVDEVHKSIDIPEAPKKNAPRGGPGGSLHHNIPLPPPPPPAGGLAGSMAALSNLMKPFSKSAARRGAESPDSSIYSPGNVL